MCEVYKLLTEYSYFLIDNYECSTQSTNYTREVWLPYSYLASMLMLSVLTVATEYLRIFIVVLIHNETKFNTTISNVCKVLL